MAHLPKGKGVIPLPPFQAWLASNIPAVYDNTMTYYEELCALLKYLQDQVVPALNENAEAITVLSEYVEHYFDDLDVQDEINNKLDEMAADGTLQEIIGQYLNATAVWGFDSVADMKSATNLIDGSYARTLGYYTKNDGGGATYKIRTITNSDVINDMTIIAITGGNLIAELIVEDEINALQCGLYSDGETDNATKLATLLNFLPEDATLLFPYGEYLFNSTVTFTKAVNIKCDGTMISHDTRPLFLFDHVKNCEININKITENAEQTVDFNENTSNNAAIILKNCLYVHVTVQEITNFVIGLMLIGAEGNEGGSYYNTIEVNHIAWCFHGIILLSLTNGYVNANKFNNIVYDYHTWSSNETPYFIQIRNVAGNTYMNNANNFYKLQAEYGVAGEGGPKMLNITHGQNNTFDFDRIEIASDSYAEPFVFTASTAKCNQVLVRYMTKSFSYTLTTDRNIVTCPVQYGNTNHQNNVKDITATLTLASNVTMPQGKVFVDYLHQLVYINITLQTSAVISANTSLVTGLPTPVEHVMLYERYATSTNLYTKSSDDTVLFISRSLVPSTIVNRTAISTNSTVNINVVYKMGSW